MGLVGARVGLGGGVAVVVPAVARDPFFCEGRGAVPRIFSRSARPFVDGVDVAASARDRVAEAEKVAFDRRRAAASEQRLPRQRATGRFLSVGLLAFSARRVSVAAGVGEEAALGCFVVATASGVAVVVSRVGVVAAADAACDPVGCSAVA